jgi:AbrB family looped-hinge helix DNA binding protein
MSCYETRDILLKFVTTPEGGPMSIHVKVMANGRMSLPADIRRRHGLAGGGHVVVEETADGIVLRTVDQAVARAQAMSRKLTAGKPGAGVSDFLTERRREAEAE